MSKRPIQRIHFGGKEGLDDSLEVRNWLDEVEDKCNDILGPVWSQLMIPMSEIITHEGIHGRGSAHELEERLKDQVERLVKEYGDD